MTKRLLFGVTAPVSARAFLVGQLGHYVEQGWEVHLVCGDEGLSDFAEQEQLAGLHVVPTHRDPSSSDVGSLFGLIRLMRNLRPDATIMSTPKMGVLGTLAARFARVPTRIYFIWGFRAEGLTGIRRKILVTMERAACRAATHVVSVSPSVQQILTDEGVCPANKVRVLGFGATNGIDTDRFAVPTREQRQQARMDFHVDQSTQVLATIGRVTRDKGLRELPGLWEGIRASFPDSTLLIAGTPEPSDSQDQHALDLLKEMAGVRLLAHVNDIPHLLHATDLVLFLSSREGMGQVPLEAGASGIPTVAYRVSGVVDTITSGKNGFLCTYPNAEEVLEAATLLLRDPDLRSEMGKAARDQVVSRYSQERVWAEWDRFLTSTLGTPES